MKKTSLLPEEKRKNLSLEVCMGYADTLKKMVD